MLTPLHRPISHTPKSITALPSSTPTMRSFTSASSPSVFASFVPASTVHSSLAITASASSRQLLYNPTSCLAANTNI